MTKIGDGRLLSWPCARGAAFPEDAMTEFTRRRVVAAAVTARPAHSRHSPRLRKPPRRSPAGRRRAFYRCKVGDFEVTAVNDGARAIPLPAQFVRNVGKEVLAAVEAAYMPKGSIIAPFNPV